MIVTGSVKVALPLATVTWQGSATGGGKAPVRPSIRPAVTLAREGGRGVNDAVELVYRGGREGRGDASLRGQGAAADVPNGQIATIVVGICVTLSVTELVTDSSA